MESSLKSTMQLEAKNSLRDFFMNLAIRGVVVFCCCMILLIAASFLMYGLVLGVGTLVAPQLWLSYSVIGGGIFCTALVAISVTLGKIKNLKREKVSDVDMLRKWAHENPFLSVAVVGTASFLLAKNPVSTPSPTVKKEGLLIPLLAPFIMDFMNETVVPAVKEYLVAFSAQLKFAEHEKYIKQAEEKMDAEGGNLGQSPILKSSPA